MWSFIWSMTHWNDCCVVISILVIYINIYVIEFLPFFSLLLHLFFLFFLLSFFMWSKEMIYTGLDVSALIFLVLWDEEKEEKEEDLEEEENDDE